MSRLDRKMDMQSVSNRQIVHGPLMQGNALKRILTEFQKILLKIWSTIIKRLIVWSKLKPQI